MTYATTEVASPLNAHETDHDHVTESTTPLRGGSSDCIPIRVPPGAVCAHDGKLVLRTTRHVRGSSLRNSVVRLVDWRVLDPLRP